MNAALRGFERAVFGLQQASQPSYIRGQCERLWLDMSKLRGCASGWYITCQRAAARLAAPMGLGIKGSHQMGSRSRFPGSTIGRRIITIEQYDRGEISQFSSEHSRRVRVSAHGTSRFSSRRQGVCDTWLPRRELWHGQTRTLGARDVRKGGSGCLQSLPGDLGASRSYGGASRVGEGELDSRGLGCCAVPSKQEMKPGPKRPCNNLSRVGTVSSFNAVHAARWRFRSVS